MEMVFPALLLLFLGSVSSANNYVNAGFRYARQGGFPYVPLPYVPPAEEDAEVIGSDFGGRGAGGPGIVPEQPNPGLPRAVPRPGLVPGQGGPGGYPFPGFYGVYGVNPGAFGNPGVYGVPPAPPPGPYGGPGIFVGAGGFAGSYPAEGGAFVYGPGATTFRGVFPPFGGVPGGYPGSPAQPGPGGNRESEP